MSHSLAPSQYEKNVAIKPNSRERVDFAISIWESDGTKCWLPVDSKFPLEDYEHYLNALDISDKDASKKHLDRLVRGIKQMAKTIGEKYVHPPHSTAIAVMFCLTKEYILLSLAVLGYLMICIKNIKCE